MQEQPASGSTTVKTEKPMIAFVLSLVAGVLVLIQGIVRLLQSRALEVSGIADGIRRRVFAGIALHIIGTVALVFGVLILVGAILLYEPSMKMAGATIVLIFSILSIITGGLFGLLGLVIGVVGSVLALVMK
jgi:hypothetical protein